MRGASANRNVRHNERVGGWEIIRAGERLASAFDETKEGAIKKAKAMVRREGGGEVRVKNDLGRIVESQKVRGLPWSRRAAA
jgi:Uncharacterized protein conserved in bacteria (DUF2188)